MKRYIIDCWNGREGRCECLTSGAGRCDRGFFSLFLQAVNGIEYANERGLQPYVDFGTIDYLFSDRERFAGDNNFWNYYFEQPYCDTPPSIFNALRNRFRSPMSYNRKNQVFPAKDWKPETITRKSCIVRDYIRFKPTVQDTLADIKHLFTGRQRVMGMHLRRTDHFQEHAPPEIDQYLTLAEQHRSNYDAFFVATDNHEALSKVIEVLGSDSVLSLDVTRSNDEQPVHKNLEHQNRYQLGLEALSDCYALSLCHKSVLTNSNLSYAALLLNPGMGYSLL